MAFIYGRKACHQQGVQLSSAIDGSHIRIKASLQQLDSYTNRKSYSTHQLYCNPTRYVTARCLPWTSVWASRTHVFSDSVPSVEDWLLTACSHTTSAYVIVPVRDTGDLSPQERHFNTIHSASRCVIERAFARLKGKFRRLKYLDM